MNKVFYYKEDVGGPYDEIMRFVLIAAESREKAWEFIHKGTSWDFVPDFKPDENMYVVPFYKTPESAKKAYEKDLRKWEKNKDKWLQEFLESKNKDIENYKEVEGLFAEGEPRIIMDDDPFEKYNW